MQQASVRAFQSAARKIGVAITQHAIGKGVSRWLPVVGAVGVGAYAYYDTSQVARTAIELFEREIAIVPGIVEERIVKAQKGRLMAVGHTTRV